MKLKYLLIAAFIVFAAIPPFVGLKYLNQMSGEYYRELFEDHLASLSLIAKGRLLAAIERVQDNTALMSSRTQMRISLAQWSKTQDPAARQTISRIIHDAKHGFKNLKEISLFDLEGSLAASTSSNPFVDHLAIPQAEKPSIRLALQDSELVVISQAPLILDHEPVGFIRLAFYARFIGELVKDRTGLGETGEWLFAVRDESGDALIAVPLKYDNKAAFRRRVAKDRLDAPIIQALLGNEQVMHAAPDYREHQVMASTRYISELDWGLLAKIDESEVNQLMHKNNTQIYITEFAIILLACITGVILSIYITNPLERLKIRTGQFAKGKFVEPKASGGWQEIKELTAHFTNMTGALQDLKENLQQKVNQQTRELKQANERLEQIAIRDPLTDLYNRRHFETRYSEEFSSAKRHQRELALVMLDIDHFKAVNDTCGHPMGDEVLQQIASYLQQVLRESDFVARLGGEEFGMLLPSCSEQGAVAFLERIREGIAAMKFIAGAKTFGITCSFGVAGLNENVSEKAALISKADQALYKAKESGRNCICIFSEDDSQHLTIQLVDHTAANSSN